MQIISPMFYNCVNVLEHEFLLNYNIPACDSGGLELGEGISKFGNKNWGIFHVFEKLCMYSHELYFYCHIEMCFGFVNWDKTRVILESKFSM